jgi:hypothetical protein
MSWDPIPKTDAERAGTNWLAELEPAKEEKRRNRLAQFKSKIEAALAPDKKLSKMFEAILEMTHYAGRVDGLREGLGLYEYGLKIEGKTAASRSMMKYVVNHAMSTPEKVCAHLDRELERIRAQKTAAASIRPPDAWECRTWTEALEKKTDDVNALFYSAKKEAQSERYCTLMAWRTWGRNKQKKVVPGEAKEQLDRLEPL